MNSDVYEDATAEQLRHPMVAELLARHEPLDGPEARSRVHTLIRASYQYTYMLHAHHSIWYGLRGGRCIGAPGGTLGTSLRRRAEQDMLADDPPEALRAPPF